MSVDLAAVRRDPGDTSGRAGGRSPGLLAIAGALALVAAFSILVPWLGFSVLCLILVVALLRLPGRTTSLVVVYVVALFLVSSRHTLGSYSITLATILGLVALAFWLLGRLTPSADVGQGFPPVVLAILGAVGLLVVTYAAGQLHHLTGAELHGADERVVELLSLAGAALLLCDTVRTRAARDRVLFAMVLAAGVIAVIGILQFVFELDLSSALRPPGFTESVVGFIDTRFGFTRVAGTARQPIEFGVVCAVLLPVALHLARYGMSALVRSLSWLSTLALVAVIPLALSRPAFIALAVVAVVMLPSWPNERRFKVVVSVLAVAGLVAILAPDRLSFTEESSNGTQGAASVAYRDHANTQAYDLASEQPWFGSGFGTFDRDAQFVLDNTYLTMLVEGGAIGMLALVVLLVVPSAVAIGVRRRSRDPAVRDLARTLLAMIAAIALASWELSAFGSPLLIGVLFITIGMVGSLSRTTPAAPPEPEPELETEREEPREVLVPEAVHMPEPAPAPARKIGVRSGRTPQW